MEMWIFFTLFSVLLFNSSCEKNRLSLGQTNQVSQTNSTSQKELNKANAYLGLALTGVKAIIVTDVNGNSEIHELSITQGTDPASAQSSLSLAGESPRPSQSFIIVDGHRLELPAGYVLDVKVKTLANGDTKALGKGSQGTAFLVRDIEGKLWAMKFDNTTLKPRIGGLFTSREEALAKVMASFQNEDVDVAKSLQSGFGNRLEAKIVHTPTGVPVVIKTAIEGGTLKEALSTGSIFSGADSELMRKDLNDLFYRMAIDGKVYEDLNPANLMWDPHNKEWVIIDAKPPKTVTGFVESLAGNIKSFVDKLPLDVGRFRYEQLRALKGVASAGLYLPDFSLTEAEASAISDEGIRKRVLYRNVQDLLGFIPKAKGEGAAKSAAEDEVKRREAASKKKVSDFFARGESIYELSGTQLRELDLTFTEWTAIAEKLDKERRKGPPPDRIATRRPATAPPSGAAPKAPVAPRRQSLPLPKERLPLPEHAPVPERVPVPERIPVPEHLRLPI